MDFNLDTPITIINKGGNIDTESNLTDEDEIDKQPDLISLS